MSTTAINWPTQPQLCAYDVPVGTFFAFAATPRMLHIRTINHRDAIMQYVQLDTGELHQLAQADAMRAEVVAYAATINLLPGLKPSL